MTNGEKRRRIADAVIRREGQNQYTQGSKRDQVADGWSDCSSLTHWAHEQAIGVDIGDDTAAQIVSRNLTTVPVKITDGVPEEGALLPGDLLFFRGRSLERKPYQYVGHVETYVGNGQISGHGSGVGPVRKNMAEYCRQRQASSSPVPEGNRGLICVRRAVPLSEEEAREASASAGSPGGAETGKEPGTWGKGDWEGVDTQQFVKDLYVQVLGREADEKGLADWLRFIEEGGSFRQVYEGFTHSREGRKRFVEELYLHLLGRSPKDGEEQSWIRLLEEGASQTQVFQGFVNSEEYKRKQGKA